MSGRGKQQPNKMPIPMSSIGLNRQEINQNVLTPPDLFPPTFFRTIKIEAKKSDLYLVNLKEQFRNDLKSSQFFIKDKKDESKIERYSDKYEAILNQPTNEIKAWNYDLFPDELKPKLKSKKEIKSSTNKIKKVTFDDLKTKLEKLESIEGDENVEDEENDKEEEEIEAGIVEEDIEEETDYAMSYFDNGEEYLNDSDNDLGDEGATF